MLLAAIGAIAPYPAVADDMTACNAAIAAVERKSAMPKRVMGTIALVESGRVVGNRVVPWPWSINVGGTSYYYDTKEAAIEAVRTFSAAGQRSIDVGCMQINLAAHPAAFDSLDTAFEPAANADYAARFLRALYLQSGRLATAMTAYHSQTPEFANDYAHRLLAVWPGAADLGLSADDPPAAPKARLSQINLDTENGRAIAARPISTRPLSPNVASIHGGAWPR
jgi:hypothetical protein